jgi:hypothetical protein
VRNNRRRVLPSIAAQAALGGAISSHLFPTIPRFTCGVCGLPRAGVEKEGGLCVRCFVALSHAVEDSPSVGGEKTKREVEGGFQH